MTINRDLIVQAFPGQPRMQAAFEALVNDAESTVASLKAAASALTGLSGDTATIFDLLATKQPKNDTLTAVAKLPTDPGVLEQIQPGIVSVRAIDTADTASLLTRALADTRYLGGAHGAASAAKLTTARNIAMTGDVSWSVTFDGSSNVTATGTIQANAVTFSKLVAATQKALIGANAAGNFQEITLGSGLSLTGGVLSATGSGGSVTSVSVVTANGVSGTVATPSTTPAITLALGAITPSSVAATGTVTGSNLSGTNTGDQTSVSGNAGTATKLATARTIAMTGDVTWTSPTFDGGANITAAGTVTRINGVALSGLVTGIVKNTTTTGVPSIAVAADFPTLNQSTTGSAATLTTSRTIDGQGFNGSANITVIAPGTHAATSKATPVDADEIPLVDSAAANVLAKLTWANLKATIATYLTGLANTWSAIQTFSAIPNLTAGGLKFPATQVPAADPNTLDDYEEGTFTPTLRFGGASVGITYGTQTARYTKVGRLVTVYIRVVLTAKGSSAGAATLATLPFAALALPIGFGPVSTANVTSVTLPISYATPSGTTVELTEQVLGTTITNANFTDTTVLNIAFSYETT